METKINLSAAKGIQKNTKTSPSATNTTRNSKRSQFLKQIIQLLKKEDVV